MKISLLKSIFLWLLMAITGFQCESLLNGDPIFYYGEASYRPDHMPGHDLPVGMQISAGVFHTCAIYAGSVHCWGDDYYGQSTPPVLSNPTQISAGGSHTCAIDDSGVVCWGDNSYGQVSIPPLNNPTHVSAGLSHTCAIDYDGIQCWGDDTWGQASPPTN
jgi:alpha-tubulin suppressor-like RCC1 family protein